MDLLISKLVWEAPAIGSVGSLPVGTLVCDPARDKEAVLEIVELVVLKQVVSLLAQVLLPLDSKLLADPVPCFDEPNDVEADGLLAQVLLPLDSKLLADPVPCFDEPNDVEADGETTANLPMLAVEPPPLLPPLLAVLERANFVPFVDSV